MNIIIDSIKHHYMARVIVFLITVALIAGMVSCVGDGGGEYELTISSTEGG
jgi:hypothetical protein